MLPPESPRPPHGEGARGGSAETAGGGPEESLLLLPRPADDIDMAVAVLVAYPPVPPTAPIAALPSPRPPGKCHPPPLPEVAEGWLLPTLPDVVVALVAGVVVLCVRTEVVG